MMKYLVQPLQRLQWSVKYKLSLAFGFVLLCFIGYGIISALLLFNIQHNEEQLRSTDNHIATLQRYQQAFDSENDLYSDALFLTKVTKIRNNFRSIITEGLSQDARIDLKASDQAFTRNFAQLYRKDFDHFLLLETLIAAGQFDEGQTKWHEFESDFKATIELLENRRTQLKAERDWGNQNLNDTVGLSLVIIVALTLLSIGVGLFSLFLIGQVLVLPLNRLQEGFKRLAEGNLDQQIQITNRDEIGGLAGSFSRALRSVQQVIVGVGIGESLQSVTGQLATASQQQAQGAAEQVLSLSEVTRTIQELSETASLIAYRAVKVADLTGTTRQQIERVAQAGQVSDTRTRQMNGLVESTLARVEQIGRQMNQFTQTMTQLNEQSEAISRVVSLLGTIAGGIHLLSLNAAIEAAGAGEYGHRFQVVAREIKQLANRASLANQEASGLIGVVQISSRAALAQSEKDGLSVQEVITSNGDMRRSLYDLTASIEQVRQAVGELQGLAGEVSQQADEIRQATEQQSQSSEQVIASARSVGLVAEQTAHSCQQISLSSRQLAVLTNQLNGVLSQVRLAA